MANTGIYGRLLRYAKPYWKMLTAGILAGFLCGGSTVGVLSAVPGFSRSFTVPREQVKKPKPGSLQEKIQEIKSSAAAHFQKLIPVDRIMEWLNVDRSGRNDAQVLSLRLMIVSAVALVFFLMFRAVMLVTNRFCMRFVGVQVVRDIRNELFNHLQEQSLKFYGKSDVGELISRVNNDTGAIERAVSSTIADLTRAPMEIFGVLVVLLMLTIERNLWFVWLLLALVLAAVVFPIFYLSRRIKRHVTLSLEKISDLNSRMHEVFTGIRIVKAFNMGEREAKRFGGINASYVRRVLRALKAELSISVVLEVMNVLIALGLMIYCYRAKIMIADVMVIVGAVLMVYQPTKRLAKVNTQIQRSLAAATRIFDVLDKDMSIKEAASPKELVGFKHAVQFENVSFAYDDSGKVLDGISFSMPKGDVIAFVGQAGCGKSTVANILGRFYDPDSGRVTIDDVDLKDVEIDSLRKIIGVVTQDTILFNDSIANNIAYGARHVDMDRVIEAARKARAHDFIAEREEGYNSVVGEKGFTLSGGQKQRIAIARALYSNPEILILDEATSALDNVTERLVQEALNELMKDRTVFAIAHRLTTIRHAHRIFVLEGGRIIEEGTHEELLELGGKYLTMNEIHDSLEG